MCTWLFKLLELEPSHLTFYVGGGNPNMDPQVYTAHTDPITEPLPQALKSVVVYLILKNSQGYEWYHSISVKAFNKLK